MAWLDVVGQCFRIMLNMRYRKLAEPHTGHTYVVTEPASELDMPLRWTLQREDAADEKLIVSEDELADKARWQPLD
jgi:hypothetical protein